MKKCYLTRWRNLIVSKMYKKLHINPYKNRAKVFAPSVSNPKNMKTFDRQKLSK